MNNWNMQCSRSIKNARTICFFSSIVTILHLNETIELMGGLSLLPVVFDFYGLLQVLCSFNFSCSSFPT